MNGFQDLYKSEGIIQLKIEKLSQFAQGALNSIRQSDTIYVRGLPWKIVASNLGPEYRDKQVDLKQRVLGYYLLCSPKNAGHAWSCHCSATLKVLAQKEGKEDYTEKFSYVFNANDNRWSEFTTFQALMNPKKGLYDEATDSIIIQAQITVNAPHGVKNMPDDVYTEYTMRSEHALFAKLKDFGFGTNRQYNTLVAIEDKLLSFNYSRAPGNHTLSLEMATHQSDTSRTVAECIFWYWKEKEIVILEKMVHTFGEAMVIDADSGMKISRISVPTNGAIPVNKKFNLVIRLLDKRIASANNSLDAYYGDYEGIETVTLNISGTTKKASFVVPKIDLIRASPVFQRMFASEMTERATGKVEIKDTDPEEFGDFLKAISPKQEHPNPSNVLALLKLADRYDCQSLRDRCELHLMNCIEIPLINRLTSTNFYRLNKLKNNLMVNLDGTGLYKLKKQLLNQNFA